jgi:hypothetical protein
LGLYKFKECHLMSGYILICKHSLLQVWNSSSMLVTEFNQPVIIIITSFLFNA